MKKFILLSAFLCLVISIAFAQNLSWAHSYIGHGSVRGQSVHTDTSGNLYYAGVFQDTLDIDPGAGVNNLVSDGYWDIYISKCDANGNIMHSGKIGGIGEDYHGFHAIDLDQSGNLFVTGTFEDTVDFDMSSGTSYLVNQSTNQACFFAKYDANLTLIWAKQMIGGQSLYPLIHLDKTGNIYVSGSFSDSIDVDPGSSTSSKLFAVGSQNGFLAKYDANGDFLWVKHFKYSSSFRTRGIDVDGAGNCYVTGFFNDSLAFGGFMPSSTVLNSNGGHDFFVLKINATGQDRWIQSIGGPGLDWPYDIQTDTQGNVLITGYFENTVDFDPNAGIDFLTSRGFNDAFVLKLDSMGSNQWSVKFGNSSFDLGVGISTDSRGNIICSGYFRGTVDFDPNPFTSFLLSSHSPTVQAGYITTLTPAGDFICAGAIVGRHSSVNDIYIDELDNLYLTGGYFDSVDVDPSPNFEILRGSGTNNQSDAYLGKYSLCASIGIPELNVQPIRIFPNPTRKTLQIDEELDINSTIDVYNTLGQKMRVDRLNNNSIDVSKLSSGVYILVISSDDTLYRQRFIKQ